MRIRTGPVVTEIHSRLPAVAKGIALHYGDHASVGTDAFADFCVSIDRPRTARRWIRPQVLFHFDGSMPFMPLPFDQAFAMLEWGLNWCVSTHCHQYLIFHSAVIARGGRALVLPAPPGSGKSTLCAGLVNRGWRLLSDELTLLEPATGNVVPLPRPVSLKNQSIDVIRRFAPDAVVGPAVHDTVKGSVAHMKPPMSCLAEQASPAKPRWVVVPKFGAGTAASLAPLAKGRAFMHLADNAFNYHLHGRRGFDALAHLIEACDCYEFSYGDLNDAVATFEELAGAE